MFIASKKAPFSASTCSRSRVVNAHIQSLLNGNENAGNSKTLLAELGCFSAL